MKQATFYIGADNVDRMVDKAKIVELVSRHFAGGTIIPATGIWRGKVEEAVVLVIGHNDDDGHYIRMFAQILCRELHQDAIGLSDGVNFKLITLND